jgi:hypothetical protein
MMQTQDPGLVPMWRTIADINPPTVTTEQQLPTSKADKVVCEMGVLRSYGSVSVVNDLLAHCPCEMRRIRCCDVDDTATVAHSQTFATDKCPFLV